MRNIHWSKRAVVGMSSQDFFHNKTISTPQKNYHQRQQQQQQQQPYHPLPLPHSNSRPHLQNLQYQHTSLQHEVSLPMFRTNNISLSVELGLHGIIAFLSLYAVCSIIATIQFQNAHGYTSFTALYLLFVTIASFIMAIGYMALAWWTSTPEGSARIRLHLQRHNRLEPSSVMESADKPKTFPSVESTTRTIVRVCTFLVSPTPRLCTLVGFVIMTLLAGVMQWYKIRRGLDCSKVAPEYRHFCATTKAAVISTIVLAFLWIVWSVLWFCQSYTVYRTEQKQLHQQQKQTGYSGYREEITIAMPEDYQDSTSRKKQDHINSDISQDPDMSHMVHITQHNKLSDSQLQYPHNQIQLSTSNDHQQQQSQLRQQQQQHHSYQQQQQHPAMNVDLKDSSLGLGIDIEKDNGVGASSIQGRSNIVALFDSSSPNPMSRSQSVMDIETASIIGKSASMIARDSIFEQEKPNPGRLRDHAKIFPHTRASTSNLYDAATGGSNRRTPVFCNDAFLSRLVIGPQTSPSISRINTPTTPRSRAGYMGKETYKAYNSIPRSASTGAVNSYNALYGFTSSAHVSPNPSLHFGESILTGTPKSHWSASMTGFPQSPADVAAAEHCMDEQLKALRRRSFATEAMNSPGGSVSLLESAQMNSPSLGTPHSELGSLYGGNGMGSPSSVFSKGKGKFRTTFSSPSLNNLHSVGRRRSSLGMSSMINSINKSHDDSDSASSSSYYSPIGSSATPHSASSSSRHSGEGDTDDHSSQYTQKHLDFAVSAQELLRAEYGDLYPVHPLSIENEQNEMENMNPDTHSIASSMGRPRSNSTSSTGTSRSNGTSVYSSINEQQQQQGHGSGRGAKQLGPPPSLMNKIRSNTNYPSSHKNHNTGQTTVKGGDLYSVVGKKSNSHPKNSKKFPSHGDLTRYSWDYRKEMPID